MFIYLVSRSVPSSSLFPYTTLFRSVGVLGALATATIAPSSTPAAAAASGAAMVAVRSEEHTSELQSRGHLVCRLLLEKKKKEIKNVVRMREQGYGRGRHRWMAQTLS